MCKIQKITIEHFRGIEHLEVDCSDRLNVFIGANGAGKSSVLEVVRLFESWFVAKMRSRSGRGAVLTERDIQVGKPFCEISVLLDNGETCTLFKQRRTAQAAKEQRSNVAAMTRLADALHGRRAKEPSSPFPIVAYYGVNRAVTDIPLASPKSAALSSVDVYSGSMDGSTCIKQFFAWFREQEDIENDEYRYNSTQFRPDGQLEAVREAIRRILPGYDNLRVSRKPLALLLEKGNVKLRFDQLSDGEKCYITLVADIARRLAMASGQNANDALAGRGVVMIDEVELHLHPSWQQEVIPKLVQTFPACQFFITTHSPIVLSDVNTAQRDVIVPMAQGIGYDIAHLTYGSP